MPNQIVTSTIPTVISMGVVSRAVDTTMGKHGKKRRVKRQFKVHKGPRGGKYIVHKGRKIYL